MKSIFKRTAFTSCFLEDCEELIDADREIRKKYRDKLQFASMLGILLASITIILSPDLKTGFVWFSSIFFVLLTLSSIKIRRLSTSLCLMFLTLPYTGVIFAEVSAFLKAFASLLF